MATKDFDIEDVLTVVTGVVIRAPSNFQEVMDVLFPGIFTIGCAAMQPTAAKELQRQHPKIREFLRTAPVPSKDTLDDFIQLARICFGDKLSVTGPLNVKHSEIKEAFEEFANH
jgi:hypothetical protein